MWSGLALKRASVGYPTAKKGESTESAVKKEQAESARILKKLNPLRVKYVGKDESVAFHHGA